MTATRIKKVGLELFAKKGYEGTALSEIAHQCGIKTPSIYAHYTSKEDLFLNIYRDVISLEADSIKQTLSRYQHLSLTEKMRYVFYHLTDFKENVVEKRFFQRAIYYPPDALKDKMKQDFSSYEILSIQLLEGVWTDNVQVEHQNAVDQTTWLQTFFCLLDGLLIQHQLYEDEEFAKRKDAAWTSLALLIREDFT